MRIVATAISELDSRDDLPPSGPGQAEHQQTSPSQSIPLRDCIRTALVSYLERMGDHQIDNFYRFVLDEVERPLYETVLRHCHGNQTYAARILGISRGTLRKKISQFGLMSANDPRNP
jgi:Fis family transcriptional regulator